MSYVKDLFQTDENFLNDEEKIEKDMLKKQFEQESYEVEDMNEIEIKRFFQEDGFGDEENLE